MVSNRDGVRPSHLWRLMLQSTAVFCSVAPVIVLSGYAIDTVSLVWTMACFFAVFFAGTVSMMYMGTVRKIEGLQVLRDGAWLQRWLSSRILTAMMAIVWSAFVALTSVFWFSSLDRQQIIFLLSSIPVYALIIQFVRPKMTSQMKRFAATKNTLRISSWLFAGTMGLLFFCYRMAFVDSAEMQPLALSVDEVFSNAATSGSGSRLVQWLGQWTDVFNIVQAYFLHQSVMQDDFYGLLAMPFYLVLFYNFALLISPFFIGRTELRRIVLPISDEEIPEPLKGWDLIGPSAWASVCIVLCISVFLDLEHKAREPVLREIDANVYPAVAVLAERIDNVFYRPGTSDELICTKLAVFADSHGAVDDLRNELRIAFASMRSNVDNYLDAYYSLPAEYLRLADLAVGNLESALSSDLERTLAEGNPFEQVQVTIDGYLVERGEALKLWQQQRDAILQDNQLDISDAGDVKVTESFSLNKLSQPPAESVLIGLEGRTLSAGVAGVSAIVATKVAAKVAVKGVFKSAALAMSKMVLLKAGGAAAGGAAGAAIGSVVPVFGTVVGGVVGATIGLAASVAAEYGLLKLEESYSRPDFKKEIIQAIDSQEVSLLVQLKPVNRDGSLCKAGQ